MSNDTGISLHVDSQALTPLIRAIVTEAIEQLDAARRQIPENGQLAFNEEQAARMLALEVHQLRDERRRGRITASQIVGRRVRYTRDDLLSYLAERRIPAEAKT